MNGRLATVTAVALACAGLTAAPATAAPAAAAGPTRSVESVEFTVEEHPYFSEECGFPVRLHVWGSFQVLTWEDREGNPTREMRLFRFRSTSEANGVSIDGVTFGPEFTTFEEDGSATVKVLGTVHRRVPGSGTVRLQYGYGLKVISADGETEVAVVENGSEDLAPLCEALAG